MRHAISAGLVLFLLHPHVPISAQTRADSAALESVAKDYIEGWYAGDATRLTGNTARGGGTRTPKVFVGSASNG
jgi:hypothetical protein